MLTVESIHPKQIASSTASGYGHRGPSAGVRHEQSHTPGAVSWFAASHDRTWRRVVAWKIG